MDLILQMVLCVEEIHTKLCYLVYWAPYPSVWNCDSLCYDMIWNRTITHCSGFFLSPGNICLAKMHETEMCNTELQLIDQRWLHLWEWMNTSCLCYRRIHRWLLTLQFYILHVFSASHFAFSSVCTKGWYYPGLFNIEIECERFLPADSF